LFNEQYGDINTKELKIAFQFISKPKIGVILKLSKHFW